MLNKLREHPLMTALVILLLYSAIFVVPDLLITPDPSQQGLNSITDMIGLWPLELGLTIAFVLIVSLLGWWREVGFRGINPGSLKFLILPFLYGGMLLTSAVSVSDSQNWLLGFDTAAQILALTVVLLMLGFTEEMMFRGVLFHGLETRYSALLVVLISATLFGLFHFVNLFTGAGYYDTIYQVLHAIAAGFMYASLRLILGAIWPVMLFHAFWDFILTTISSMSTHTDTAAATSFEPAHALFTVAPATLYGLFVYWRWSVRSKRQREESGAGSPESP